MLSKEFGGISIQLSRQEADMVTHPTRAVQRDKLISGHLGRVAHALSRSKPGAPIVCFDTHAGAGGDSLLFMRFLHQSGFKSRLILSQPPCDNGRERRLQHNVESYRAAIGSSDVAVELFAKTFQGALDSVLSSGEELRIDVMNIDVPWGLDAGYKEENCRGGSSVATRITTQIVRSIVDDVFKPLEERKVAPPAFICLKVPASFEQYEEELMEATTYLQDHVVMTELPVWVKNRLRYYYVLLVDLSAAY